MMNSRALILNVIGYLFYKRVYNRAAKACDGYRMSVFIAEIGPKDTHFHIAKRPSSRDLNAIHDRS